MPNIQYEIFGQLERGDLDACQLVCRDWRNFVDENAARLPLHVLSSVVLVSFSDRPCVPLLRLNATGSEQVGQDG